MNQLNSIILEGNVCKDPEIKEINGEKNLATFSIAVNRYYKKADGEFEQETSYFDVDAWGENFVKLIKDKASKGVGVRVVGRLKQNRWQDKEGKWQSRVSVIAEHVEFRAVTEKKTEVKDEHQKKGKPQSNPFQTQEEDPLPKAAGFDIF